MKLKNNKPLPPPDPPAPPVVPIPGHGPRPPGLNHRVRHLTPDWSDLPCNAQAVRALQVCAVANVPIMLVGCLQEVHDMAILQDLAHLWGVKTDITVYDRHLEHNSTLAKALAARACARIRARGFNSFVEVPRTPVSAHLSCGSPYGTTADHIARTSTSLPMWKAAFNQLGARVGQAKALTNPAAREILRQAATELRYTTAAIQTCVRLAHAVEVMERPDARAEDIQPGASAVAEAVQYTLRF